MQINKKMLAVKKNKAERVPIGSISLAVCAGIQSLSWIDPSRITGLAIAVSAVTAMIVWVKNECRCQLSSWGIILLAIILFCHSLASLPFSQSAGSAWLHYPLKMIYGISLISLSRNAGRFNSVIFSSAMIIFMIPLLFSFFASLNLSWATGILIFLQIENYPGFGRFGGVFGPDVNTLGLYSTIVFIFLIFILRNCSVLKKLFSAVILVPIASLIISSGTRVGIIAAIMAAAVSILLSKKSIPLVFVWIRQTCWAAGYIILATLVTPNVYLANSISRITGGSAYVGDFQTGNLATATNHLKATVKNDFSGVDFLIGKSANLKFVDSLWVDFFIKYGLIGFCFLILLGFPLLLRTINTSKKDGLILFATVFTLAVSLKGLFPLAGYFISFASLVAYYRRDRNGLILAN